MERMTKQAFLRALFAALVFVVCLQAQTLKQIATIDLPGPKGERFDYLTMDDEDHYLLSAHLGPGILYVIDVRTNKLVKAIPGVPGITDWNTCRVFARSTFPIGVKRRLALWIFEA